MRLFIDVFDYNCIAATRTELSQWHACLATLALLAVLTTIAIAFSHSPILDGFLAAMVIAFGFAAAIHGRLSWRWAQRFDTISYEWHDIREQGVQVNGLDEKAYNRMIRQASAFARDENSIVYYFAGKDTSDPQSYRTRFIKFGFLNAEQRILFRMKFL